MSGTPQKSPGGGGGAYENSPRPRDDAPPHCARHSLPASLLQTKTTAKGNQGRWFWTCSVRGSEKCPFFKWSDSTGPSPHRKRKAGAEDPGATPGTTPSPGSAPPSTKVFLTLVAESARFAAVSDYNTDLVECFRSLRPEGARWEPAEKHWSFPNEARDALLDRLRRSVPAGGLEYEVQRVPAFVRDLLASHYAQHAPQEEVADRLARLPSAQGKQFSLTHNLKGYQREGLIAMLRQRGRALLADEMGLGKTPQAIALAACYPEDWPLLVICPSTLRETWRRALADWLPPGFATVHTMKTGADVPPPPLGGASRRCTIVSYDMASLLPASTSYGIVVADECHLLKNGDTVRARACLPLLQRAKRALLVSGTPYLQRPAELFTQLVAACHPRG